MERKNLKVDVFIFHNSCNSICKLFKYKQYDIKMLKNMKYPFRNLIGRDLNLKSRIMYDLDYGNCS